MTAVWLNRHPDVCDHGNHWDQYAIRQILERELISRHDPVLVVPGRFHASEEDVQWVLQEVHQWEPPAGASVTVVITSDEEGLFPWWRLRREGVRVWVMTPKPSDVEEHGRPDVILGEGYGPRCRELLARAGYRFDRNRDWGFAGQVTHDRRREMLQAMETLQDLHGALFVTDGFMRGLPLEEYYQRILCDSRVAVCPSGPATADSFRAYEAMTAGCAVILDDQAPAYGEDDRWWGTAYPGAAVTTIRNWSDLRGRVREELENWPLSATVSSAWYSRERHRLRRLIREHADVTADPDLTIVVTTSPCEQHPSTAMIAETIGSALQRFDRDPEIVIVADGVRPEQEAYRERYEEYLHHLAWHCNVTWDRAMLYVMPSWVHQANCVRAALDFVSTGTILVMEHDAPLQGEIDFDGIMAAIEWGKADVVRLHHESHVLTEHEPLMIGKPEPAGRFMMRRTKQWSQRPHVALTAYYRDIIDRYFGHESRTMIEDVMHGVVRNQINTDQLAWNRHKIWLYHEQDEHGSIQRSYHLDGRGSDEKYEMKFRYDGATPPGAPAPMG